VSLAGRIAAGELVLTSELPSVDGGGLDAVRERVAPLAPWVDAVNATDNTAAHAHASSLAVSIALRRLGVEPIMQLTCRDRNRLALEADLVGAALHGVESVLALRGDDVTAGDEPDAGPVFDLDSVQLLRTAGTLMEGRYLSGRPIEPPPRFFPGAVETPGAPAFAERAAAKVAAGARFFQLQICFRPELLESFLAEVRGLPAAFLPSIPLVSTARSLRFMDEKVPGIEVPGAVIERVERAGDEAAACLDLALDLAERTLALAGAAGLHLIAFRRPGGVEELCRRLGLRGRAERRLCGSEPQSREGHGDRPQVAV
jgi:methylenetetrahydrofolate reductase (NADPH)